MWYNRICFIYGNSYLLKWNSQIVNIRFACFFVKLPTQRNPIREINLFLSYWLHTKVNQQQIPCWWWLSVIIYIHRLNTRTNNRNRFNFRLWLSCERRSPEEAVGRQDTTHFQAVKTIPQYFRIVLWKWFTSAPCGC